MAQGTRHALLDSVSVLAVPIISSPAGMFQSTWLAGVIADLMIALVWHTGGKPITWNECMGPVGPHLLF